MSGSDWLAARRSEVAAERILDAAGRLFIGRDPASVGMNEIATAAGCSRATLYRYFENRDALYGAYVHREARALHQQLTEHLAGVDDPAERLVTGVIEAIALVRANPALASWFTGPIGAEMADRSEVITAMVAAFLSSLGSGDQAESRARWVVRVLMSLLILPGRDAADERAMLERFVAPIVVPKRTTPA